MSPCSFPMQYIGEATAPIALPPPPVGARAGFDFTSASRDSRGRSGECSVCDAHSLPRWSRRNAESTSSSSANVRCRGGLANRGPARAGTDQKVRTSDVPRSRGWACRFARAGRRGPRRRAHRVAYFGELVCAPARLTRRNQGELSPFRNGCESNTEPSKVRERCVGLKSRFSALSAPQ